MGRDMLQSLGIDLDSKESSITWKNNQAHIKTVDVTLAKHLANVEVMKTIAENMSRILDTKYCKVDLQIDAVNQFTTLGTEKKKKELNKQIKQKPYPIPEIQDILLKWKVFSMQLHWT
eukprot:11521511-Ditylum_brightwellii.AAC.1